ncbi:hypothetical protein PGIGA_G00252380 [Pangasianodon gigas]|uniref:Uncharacterized protein n=1 Tax=Pangasianodon gigas TaxID=30993 RepID=A0ACC5WR22_PANGG|nr:hypothetical protein [Pangasianodon gigas]
MLPPWSLGTLLLSSVLGFPVYHNDTRNITSNDDVSHEPLHLNSNASVSSKVYNQSQAMHPHILHDHSFPSKLTMNRISCPLSTCSLHHLASILRPGDENAGSTVSDPHGPGKK